MKNIKNLLITFLLIVPLSLKATYIGPDLPLSTVVDTDGYTVPAGKKAWIIPKDWGTTLNSAEICVVKKETIQATLTTTNTDELVHFPLKTVEKYDNVNITIVRSSGTVKEIDTFYAIGSFRTTNISTSQANTFPGGSGAAAGASNLMNEALFAADASQAASVDIDFNVQNGNYANGVAAGLINGIVGSQAAGYDFDNMFYIAVADSDSGSTTFDTTFTYYKCSEVAGFWAVAGDVISSARIIRTEYNL